MNDDLKQQEFLHKSRQALDDSISDMDAVTATRLRSARRNAVASVQSENNWMSRWAPAGGFAFATIAGVAFLLTQSVSTEIDTPFADLEILASSEELNLYEDLEFYRWLAAQQSSEQAG